MRTPNTAEEVRAEAIALATDVTALLVRHRGEVRPEQAYVLAMECVRVADRVLKGDGEPLPWEAAARFMEARTAAVRALVALDRAGAHADLPPLEVREIEGRMHRVALALADLALGRAG
jgi:hypothetical protein